MDTSQVDRFRAERGRILDEGNQAMARAGVLDEIDDERDHDLAGEQLRARHKATARYRELLPDVRVSRCPFTGELLTWALDTVDLDGWCWNYEATIRRVGHPIRTFLALTGAMKIVEPVTRAPFIAMPGPGVPYVIPRILSQSPETIAVVAQIAVGRHTGWPITYFSPWPAEVELENEWGSCQYYISDGNGDWLGWDEKAPAVRHYDFDLEPWISSGKLRWIAPGDETMTVRQGLADCPYVGLEGPRRFGFVDEGKVRYPS